MCFVLINSVILNLSRVWILLFIRQNTTRELERYQSFLFRFFFFFFYPGLPWRLDGLFLPSLGGTLGRSSPQLDLGLIGGMFSPGRKCPWSSSRRPRGVVNRNNKSYICTECPLTSRKTCACTRANYGIIRVALTTIGIVCVCGVLYNVK